MRQNVSCALCVLVLLIAGCSMAQAGNASKMEPLGSALIRLGPSVEEAVCCDQQAANMTGEELLRYAARNNPEKLTPFSGYLLKVQRQGAHAAILVCTSDGRTALLEDATCTFKVEKQHWQANPPLPCEFTLDLVKTCP